MKHLAGITVILFAGGLLWLVTVAAFPRIERGPRSIEELPVATSDWRPAVAGLDACFARQWQTEQISPVPTADDLTILRRLSLALHGTIPSLEEIRRFETDTRDDRLSLWTAAMLEDSRFPNYFSERLARTFVGTKLEPFLIYRRDRFKAWLGEQLKSNRPYSEMVFEIISGTGLWTGKPATNFITHATLDGDPDEAILAGRTVRAVLGQRIDCAECHDHPFANWKQQDFEGLAAFYGQIRLSPFGVEDNPTRVYQITDSKTQELKTVAPSVPFGERWLKPAATRRQELAGWCISPENRRFARATVNRMWALMFGKAISEGAPYYSAVDDLPDPEENISALEQTPLEFLAADFANSGYNLKRLLLIISASQPFRMTSQSDFTEHTELQNQIDHWAVFPLVRLRPEQVIGSLLQATSIKTVDQNSALLTRTIRLFREADFVREYGDFGDDELISRSGTVPQALLRMNGKLVQETTEPNPFNATPRLAIASGSEEQLLENTFLISLTRKPTDDEQEYFRKTWAEAGSRRGNAKVHDLYWILFNSPEFSWNH